MKQRLEFELKVSAANFREKFDQLYAVDEPAAIKLAMDVLFHIRDKADRTAINDELRNDYNMGLLSPTELMSKLIA